MSRRKSVVNSPESEPQDPEEKPHGPEGSSGTAAGDPEQDPRVEPENADVDPPSRAMCLMREAEQALVEGYPEKARPQQIADVLRKLGTAQRWLEQFQQI